MALILRIIRKSRWYLKPSWLSEGEIQADAFGDLLTLNNELSVWHIDDNRSNLERVIAALAAKRDVLANFDFVLFNQNILEANRLKFLRTREISLDREANDLWHLDLYELSASKLMNLAVNIANSGELTRISEREIKKIIMEAITLGTIRFENLNQNLKQKFEIQR